MIVTDYVTVTPVSDGALTATVTCKRPFDGEIIITVVTRAGKCTATCLVTYVGAPTKLNVTPNELSATPHADIGSYYALPTGGAYTFSLSADNEFEDVRAECVYSFNVTAVGQIVTQDKLFNGSTLSSSWIEGTRKTLSISSITRVTNFIPSALDVTVSGNQLRVVSNATLKQYYSSEKRSGQNATYYDSFVEYVKDDWYYLITVNEQNSGVNRQIKVRPIASVDRVTVDKPVIGF